jgi:molybdopterin-guanine dinucleotide biosynthesis protein A
MSRNTIGAILAGGKNSRMGTDKALLKLNGRPLVHHVAATMQGVFDRIIVVTNDVAAYRFLGLEIVTDIFRECGPLGGIHAALSCAGESDIFVAASDTPLISRELLKYLHEYSSAAPVKVPLMKERIHPLCGVYASRCLHGITEQLKAGSYRVLDFVGTTGSAIIPITPDLPFCREDLFSNFNTPEDVAHHQVTH